MMLPTEVPAGSVAAVSASTCLTWQHHTNGEMGLGAVLQCLVLEHAGVMLLTEVPSSKVAAVLVITFKTG